MPPKSPNKLLERVVGALVVCSFGYILYSILLDSRSENNIDRSTEIPLRLESIDPGQFTRERSELALPAEPMELFTPTESVNLEGEIDTPVIDSAGQPNGWVIQVGSFSQQLKAEEIVDLLKAQGLKAYTLTIASDGESEPLHRVLVGPYLNSEYALNDQNVVNQSIDVESLLLKFDP